MSAGGFCVQVLCGSSVCQGGIVVFNANGLAC